VDGRLVELARVVDSCQLLRPFAVAPEELVESFDLLQQLAQQVEAVRLAYLAEIHGRGVAVSAGATSTSVWLRERHRVSSRSAYR
jgi:hypothetical protein